MNSNDLLFSELIFTFSEWTSDAALWPYICHEDVLVLITHHNKHKTPEPSSLSRCRSNSLSKSDMAKNQMQRLFKQKTWTRIRLHYKRQQENFVSTRVTLEVDALGLAGMMVVNIFLSFWRFLLIVSLQFINTMSRQQKCGVFFLLALLATGKIFHRSFVVHIKPLKTPSPASHWAAKMLRFLIVNVKLSLCEQGTFSLSSEGFTARIIGGQEVPRFSIKYQVSLQSSRGHYCGATLVHPQWVVSAAHCWIPWVLQPTLEYWWKKKTRNQKTSHRIFKMLLNLCVWAKLPGAEPPVWVLRSSLMKVVLSEHNLEVTEGFEQVYNVSKIYINKFNYWTFDNDIMLIKVSAGSESSLVSIGQAQNECLCGSWASQHSSTPTSSRLSCRTPPPRRWPLIPARWAAGAWRRSTAPTSRLCCAPWTSRSSPTAGGITTGGWSPPTCCVPDHVWVEKTPVRYRCFPTSSSFSLMCRKQGSCCDLVRHHRGTLAGRWFVTAALKASCRGGSDVRTRTSLESTPTSGTMPAGSMGSSKTTAVYQKNDPHVWEWERPINYLYVSKNNK